MTGAGALGLTSKANPLTATYVLNLKLSNPANADSFADQRFVPPPQPGGSSGFQAPYLGPVYSTWDGVAAADALLVQDAQSVLEPGALLAIASVTVLVGRRLSEYARRVGLLKAVGGTPGMVAAMFLAENLVLALLAAAVGLAAGALAAPLLTSPGAALVGSAGAPSLTEVTALKVIGVALAVALAATLVPAIRAARTSTVAAINDVARPPRRRGALIKMSAGLPVPVLFGLRLVGRRPRRALLSAANIAVTVCGIVAVLSFHATVNSRLATAASESLTAGGLSDPVVTRDEQMLTVVTIMVVVLASLNAIFTTWATVIDTRRASALMRALGARVPQVSSGGGRRAGGRGAAGCHRGCSAWHRAVRRGGQERQPAARVLARRRGARGAARAGRAHRRPGAAWRASAGSGGSPGRGGLRLAPWRFPDLASRNRPSSRPPG